MHSSLDFCMRTLIFAPSPCGPGYFRRTRILEVDSRVRSRIPRGILGANTHLQKHVKMGRRNGGLSHGHVNNVAVTPQDKKSTALVSHHHACSFRLVPGTPLTPPSVDCRNGLCASSMHGMTAKQNCSCMRRGVRSISIATISLSSLFLYHSP